MKSRGDVTIMLLAAAAAFPATLFGVVKGSSRVITQGEFTPTLSGAPEEVAWLGLRVFISINQGPIDALTGLPLAVAGGLAFLGALVLARRAASTATRPVALGIVGMFLVWMASDEMLGLHETVGHNLIFLREAPVIRRADDLLVLVGALALLAVAAWLRDQLVLPRPARIALGLAAGCMVLAVAGDFGHVRGLVGAEEALEGLGAVLVLACVVFTTLCALEDAFAAGGTRPRHGRQSSGSEAVEEGSRPLPRPGDSPRGKGASVVGEGPL